MKTAVHGALVEVYGVGTALLGVSGVGKSECALELVSRGHRIVADDVIELDAMDDGSLIGWAPERIRKFLIYHELFHYLSEDSPFPNTQLDDEELADLFAFYVSRKDGPVQ